MMKSRSFLIALLVLALGLAIAAASASSSRSSSPHAYLADTAGRPAAILDSSPDLAAQHAFSFSDEDDNDTLEQQQQQQQQQENTPSSPASSSSTHRPGRIILIRHGEKQKGGGKGLAPKGKLRAQCLKHVFGRGEYKVDYIMAQAYKPDGRRSRPYQTVKPLADHLGIHVDLHCEREQADCVARRALAAVDQGKTVLICWQHKALSDIARAFGVHGLRYPPSRSDILFQLSHRGKVSAIRSEECSGLDDDFRGWHGSKKMRPEDKLVDDESWAPGMGEHHLAARDDADDGAVQSVMDSEARAEADREAEVLLANYDLDELADIFAPVHINSDSDD
ncbi:hypothetical protein OC842_004743 [Tilletia horrida]|uniref:Phosphoglycerate mutase family protein n=1 Tax=Tilletia horrida TaxID=155126 RepID=A0AAN6GBH6_9BASI|nr:hypothetical protein OC842_004743 [Tilletia horrida]